MASIWRTLKSLPQTVGALLRGVGRQHRLFQQQGTDDDQAHHDGAPVEEGTGNADVGDQGGVDVFEQQAAAAEGADGDAGNQAFVGREPLNQVGQGGDIGDTDRKAHHHAGQQVDHVERADVGAGDQAQAYQDAGTQRQVADAEALLQLAGEQRGEGQEEAGDGEGGGDVRQSPVELVDQRLVEQAPGVDGAQAHLTDDGAENDCCDLPVWCSWPVSFLCVRCRA